MILEGKAGRLLVKAYETRGELGRAAAQEAAQALREVIAAKGGCNVIFAAAPSQNEMLEALTGRMWPGIRSAPFIWMSISA